MKFSQSDYHRPFQLSTQPCTLKADTTLSSESSLSRSRKGGAYDCLSSGPFCPAFEPEGTLEPDAKSDISLECGREGGREGKRKRGEVGGASEVADQKRDSRCG